MPEHWRRKAHETRALAARVSLSTDKLSLLRMAEDYDRQTKAAAEKRALAAMARHEAGGPGPSRP